MDTETIIIEHDLDNFPCPTEEELSRFINSFHEMDKVRVCCELMVLTGARVSEAVAANVEQFTEDFTSWKYRINKPSITISYDEDNDKVTRVVDYKVRTVQVPRWYAAKLQEYHRLNRLSMESGYLFYNRRHDKLHLDRDEIRNIIYRKRRKLKLQRIWKIVVKADGSRQYWYVMACHSFRRFYISEMFNKLVHHGVQNALTMVGKMLGHSLPLKTTSIYLSPRVATRHALKLYDPKFLKNSIALKT